MSFPPASLLFYLHCVSHKCNMEYADNLVIFRPVNTCLLSRDAHLTPLQSPSWGMSPRVPLPFRNRPQKHDYLSNILLIVHLGWLLIKTQRCFCVCNKSASAIVIRLGGPPLLLSWELFIFLYWLVSYGPLSGKITNDEPILNRERSWCKICRQRTACFADEVAWRYWKSLGVLAFCHMVP